MSGLSVRIRDNDSKLNARVTKYGQLVTAPLQYSTPIFREMNSTGTAFNFITPSAGKSIVITDIIASADKSVSNTTPADIIIFSAAEANLTTPIQTIVRPQLTGSSNFTLPGQNIIIGQGLWINATTDDATILLTIMFYLVPAGDI